MHPILFRIPFPKTTLPLGWIFLGLGLVAFAFAAWQFFAGKKPNAIGGAIVGALLVGARFYVASKPEYQTYELAPIPIYSYGVMLGLSLVVGWYLTLGLAEREGLPKETMANNYVVTAIAAVIGSRVLYVLTNLDEFDSVASMFAMRRGGLVAYGGFLGGFLGSYFFLRRHRIPLMPWADVAVPSLASGLMITRIGCYLFGCDFGKPLSATAPLWLQKLGTFPHWPDGTLEHGSGSPAWVQHVKSNLILSTADASLPVHPTQLYESLVGVGLLVFLLTMRRFQRFRGQIFLLFTFAYGICRFLLEIFRDDAERGSIPPAMQEHLLLSLSLVVLGAGYVVGFSKMVESKPVRRVTEVLAFAPAVLVYLLKRPETFAQAETYQLSTSQFVAVTTGFGAAIAFNVFYKAALTHPESAMALNLPPDPTLEPEAAAKETEEEDEGDEEEERKPATGAKARQVEGKVKPVDEDKGKVGAKSADARLKKKKLKKKGAGKTRPVEAAADAPAADEEPAAAEKPPVQTSTDDDADDEGAARPVSKADDPKGKSKAAKGSDAAADEDADA